MFSPSNLMKRVGVGGGLVPFFKCVCVYFAALPSEGNRSLAAAAAAKCAPVLCLVLAVLFLHNTDGVDRGRYARRVALGLTLSALGDALLVFPHHFVAGMAAFAVAHVAYISALGFKPLRPATGLVCYAATAVYLANIEPPSALRLLVPIYGMLLATMSWRGLASWGYSRTGPVTPDRPVRPGSLATAAAPVGALLFLVSDAILGYSLFAGPVPYKQVLVMSTYYSGQLGIALSALLPPTTAPSPAPARVTSQ